MSRKGIYFILQEGQGSYYKEVHDAIWPELRDVLTEAGICNYSIWNVEDKLFAYYEVADEEKMDFVLSSSPVYQKWRREMEQYVYQDPITGQKEWFMEMMFYHQ